MSVPEFSWRTRAHNLRQLSSDCFDLVVVGGGITGAGLARAAAMRGLSVALIERVDFAKGTSSRSSKLIHGGLRYLRQGDLGIVRESAAERVIVHRLAPYLARPRQMLAPSYRRIDHAKIRAGLFAFDRIATRINPAHEPHKMLTRAEALLLEPRLRSDKLYSCGVHQEFLTDDARLVIAVIKSAARLGAIIANHIEATGFEVRGGRLHGVLAKDALTQAEFLVRGKKIINAAGPWVDALRMRCEPREASKLSLTKGVHVAVDKARLPIERIVMMQAADKRLALAVPHADVTYFGTTDSFHDRPEDDPKVTAAEVDYLIDCVNRSLNADLSPRDVLSVWAGLRPLLHAPNKRPSELSRRHEIMVGKEGLISIAGGKLTTFRRMAERTLDKVFGPVPSTEGPPLAGGEVASVEALALGLSMASEDPRGAERLAHMYGSEAPEVLSAGASRLGAAPLLRGEVEHAVNNEMAMTLEDLLERRSRLLIFDPRNGLDVAEAAAEQMGRLLDWSPSHREAQLAQYRAHVSGLMRFSSEKMAVHA